MNYKISIVGTRETIIGFKALGLEPVYVSEPAEAVESLYSLKRERVEHEGESRNKYAIVFIMEDLMSAITDDDYKKLTADPFGLIHKILLQFLCFLLGRNQHILIHEF